MCTLYTKRTSLHASTSLTGPCCLVGAGRDRSGKAERAGGSPLRASTPTPGSDHRLPPPATPKGHRRRDEAGGVPGVFLHVVASMDHVP